MSETQLVFLEDQTFKWCVDAMVFHVFIFVVCFWFRTNSKKGHLDESNFRHCRGNYFGSAILEVA